MKVEKVGECIAGGLKQKLRLEAKAQSEGKSYLRSILTNIVRINTHVPVLKLAVGLFDPQIVGVALDLTVNRKVECVLVEFAKLHELVRSNQKWVHVVHANHI